MKLKRARQSAWINFSPGWILSAHLSEGQFRPTRVFSRTLRRQHFRCPVILPDLSPQESTFKLRVIAPFCRPAQLPEHPLHSIGTNSLQGLAFHHIVSALPFVMCNVCLHCLVQCAI